ncbi:MAG: hypothetical protein VX435_11970 [Planctomycetota bacterium]|nr:hypothetical protein [Planctomycetota bacterium]
MSFPEPSSPDPLQPIGSPHPLIVTLHCTCGSEVRPARTSQPLFILCRQCGNTLFVLPQSAFSGTSPLALDHNHSTSDVHQQIERSTSWTTPSPRSDHKDSATKPAHASPHCPHPATPSQATQRTARPWWKRPKLILVIALPIIILTLFYQFRWSTRTVWVNDLYRSRTEGIRAYQTGNFPAAQQALSLASKRLNQLGKTTREAQDFLNQERQEGAFRVEQVSRELSICSSENRLPISLSELVEEAHSHRQQEGTDHWLEHFSIHYRGKSILLDSEVTVTLSKNDEPTYQLPYLFHLNDDLFVIQLSSLIPDFFQYIDLSKPRRVFFGARLESVSPDPEHLNHWIISFQPSSGVLLTRPELLENTDLFANHPEDDSLKSLLNQQRSEVESW